MLFNNKMFLFFISFVLIIQILSISSSDSNSCLNQYIVVVDAGSSGTRFNLFIFERVNNHVKLLTTYYYQTGVALSSFSINRADWTNLRHMFSRMLEKILQHIPNECVKKTPYYVKATAGMRQIDGRMSVRILNHVKEIVKKSPLLSEADSVSILNTPDEGRLAWVSLNYLMEKLHDNTQTVGSMDLGGGSTQIAFETSNPNLINSTKVIKIFGRDRSIYCGGYDYQGINEIRMRYLNAKICLKQSCENKVLRSPCINENVNREFQFGNLTITVGGLFIPISKRVCICYEKALSYVKNIKSIRKYISKNQSFLTMSAFYYIFRAANLLEPVDTSLYKTSMKSIIYKMFSACKAPENPIEEFTYNHFLCLDLTYVVALLHNGYGFEWYDTFLIAKKINSVSLSWALGFAITKL